MPEVKYLTDHGEVRLSADTVRKYLVNGGGRVSNQEIMYFLALCKYQALNPFLREAYLIKYSDTEPATIVVGKDTFTKRAAKAPQFDGAEAGVVISIGEGIARREGTLVLPNEKLIGGWAKVYRKDWAHPAQIEINLNEYIGKKRDGSVNRQWTRMPATMIRKVALVQALREAFPDRFQGMYDAAEMQQVDSEALPADIVELPEKPAATEQTTSEESAAEPAQEVSPTVEAVKETLDAAASAGWEKPAKQGELA